MADSRLFTAGSLFTTDYLAEAIQAEPAYLAVDVVTLRERLATIAAAGGVLPPFVWDEARRLNLRAKLDAVFFILYGVFNPAHPAESRDDIRYIYSTFPIVEREEIAAHGRYLSRDLCLAWINALMAGEPGAEISV